MNALRVHALLYQIVRHGLRPPAGQLQVVQLAPHPIGVPRYPDALHPVVLQDIADHQIQPLPGRVIQLPLATGEENADRKSTRLNSSHVAISYAVFCLKKKKNSPRSRTRKKMKSTKSAASTHN